LYERGPVFPQPRAIPGRPFPPQAESRTTATELLRPSARLLRPRVLVHGDSGARCTYCRIPESTSRVGSADASPELQMRAACVHSAHEVSLKPEAVWRRSFKRTIECRGLVPGPR